MHKYVSAHYSVPGARPSQPYINPKMKVERALWKILVNKLPELTVTSKVQQRTAPAFHTH